MLDTLHFIVSFSTQPCVVDPFLSCLPIHTRPSFSFLAPHFIFSRDHATLWNDLSVYLLVAAFIEISPMRTGTLPVLLTAVLPAPAVLTYSWCSMNIVRLPLKA